MSASNRADRITKLVNALKKKFKPYKPVDRPLFETLLYACLLENSSHESAEKAIEHLEKNYFDWNEVRVSTRRELAEALKPLNDPAESADRLKRTLQSVFESVYAFDIEAMKKQNLGQSVKQISSYDGVTPFAVAYVTQNALSGHAIPCNKGLLLSFLTLDLISEPEHKKGAVPGLERAVPKNKGVEVGSILHQLGVEVGRSPYGQAARKLLTDLDPSCKSRLPKRPPKPSEKKPAEKAAPQKAEKAKDDKPKADKSKAKASAKAAPKKPAPKKAPAAAKKPAKKAAKPAPAKKKPAKAAAKKATKKPATKKATPAKKKAKAASAKKTVKKPAKKPAKKKAAKKKTATKAKRKPR